MFAGINNIDVDLLVQVMRNRAIDRFDLRIREKLLVIRVRGLHARHVLLKPGGRGRDGVAHRHDTRFEVDAGQMAPARRRAGEFLAHQAAADDAERYGFFRH